MSVESHQPPLWRSEAFVEDLEPALPLPVWRQPAWWRSLALALMLVTVGALQAEAAPDAASCRQLQPPADAGVAATPGGFVLVHPRNADLPAQYSGCRTLWVMQSEDRLPLLMRVHFQQGRAVAVEAFDGRGDAPQAPPRRCSIPSGERACAGVEQHPFVARQLPTWPRICAVEPQRPVCQGDPQ
ncbi:MAG: hypothetical protein KBC73_11425 [Burkholderiaceae bacterium]|nr:hypothetical protein [Burkholderiaceae bacterium]